MRSRASSSCSFGHVVATIGTDVEVLAQFPVEQHRAAFIAFGPKVLGHLAAREDRVDAWAHVVGDPVHAAVIPVPSDADPT